MNVLVACETSGVVRDAFKAKGHRAVSCDILDTEVEGEHYKGDVLDILGDGWDILIAHPPCRYLCASGMHWTTRGLRDPQLTVDALEFAVTLLECDIPKKCIENPMGKIGSAYRKASQYIQPYQFGHDTSKKTGLWLSGLPMLEPTREIPPERWACCGKWQDEGQCNYCHKKTKPRWSNQTPRGQDVTEPSKDRWKKRSKTFSGIALAMAEQWG